MIQDARGPLVDAPSEPIVRELAHGTIEGVPGGYRHRVADAALAGIEWVESGHSIEEPLASESEPPVVLRGFADGSGDEGTIGDEGIEAPDEPRTYGGEA